MKARVLIYTLCIILIVAIQSTILDYVKVYNVKPNLLIVFIIAVALLRGNVEGAIIGFFAGLSQDVVSGKLLGFYSLLGLYLGLIIGSVNKRLYRENIFVVIFFTFLASFLYEWIVYFISVLSNGQISLFFALRKITSESVYNSIMCIIIYIIVIKIDDWVDDVNKVSRKY